MNPELLPDAQTLRDQATAQLEAEIERGRSSVKNQNDWVSEEEMLSHFGLPVTGKRAVSA